MLIEEKLEMAKTSLANLGGTSREVFYALRTGGFVGFRNSNCECPVARYLRQNLQADLVEVDSQTAYIEADGCYTNKVPIPDAEAM